MEERNKTKTGTPALIIGIILLSLQTLSIAGNAKASSLALICYDFLYFVGRFGVGMVGLILVVVAICKKTKPQHKNRAEAQAFEKNCGEIIDVETVSDLDEDVDAFTNDGATNKYSLKGFSMEKLCEDGIVEELSVQGINVYEQKYSVNVRDGSVKQNSRISPKAFTKVCVMLMDERREKNLTKNNVRELAKRLRLRNIAIIVVVCALLGVCFLAWSFHSKNADLRASVNTLESSVRAKDSKIKSLEDEVTDGILATARLNSIEDEYEFFHKHAVVISDTSKKTYHRHGCDRINNDNFAIVNMDAAIRYDYEACSYCFGE